MNRELNLKRIAECIGQYLYETHQDRIFFQVFWNPLKSTASSLSIFLTGTTFLKIFDTSIDQINNDKSKKLES